jgi:hypothetical protein
MRGACGLARTATRSGVDVKVAVVVNRSLVR